MKNDTDRIAIIGMSGAFPGASDINSLWNLINDKAEGLSTFSREELLAAGEDPSLVDDPLYVSKNGFLETAEFFDNAFFEMTAAESLITDPQHRLFLTHSWLALEDAGYDPTRVTFPVGVFAGSCVPEYWFLQKDGPHARDMTDYRLMLGNDKDFLATRVSYKLNLKGPSFNVQSACSTSLVSVSVAVQNLLSRGCYMALAGGVSVTGLHGLGYPYVEGMIYSRTGKCRPFDIGADGVVFGEGVGVVCLKRLSDALNDGDYVYAVVESVAVNNDGSDKAGFAAPSPDGQAAAITLAQETAGINPDDIGYVETHGTATALGDVIEIEALTKAFRKGTTKSGFCRIGSLKANIGHLDAAAGIASLIKTALIVNRGIIPPQCNFERPNPKLRLEESPFAINTEAVSWELREGKRYAGISSFGIGGTNVHVILSNPPQRVPATGDNASPLLLSAKSVISLEETRRSLAAYIQAHTEIPVEDIVAKVSRSRHDFAFRWGTPVISRDDLMERLATQGVTPKVAGNPECIFVFPGQGAQFSGMAQAYYGRLPAFTECVDRGIAAAESLGFDRAREYLLGDAAGDAVNRTETAQPLLYIMEFAIASELISRGITPSAVAGHSIGEYAAAAIAGVFSFERGLELVLQRGFWMQRAPEGAMTAISLPMEEITPYLGNGITISLQNSASQVVLSGAIKAVTELEGRLARNGIAFTRLRTSHAFHSPLMNAILEDFRKHAAKFSYEAPAIPFLSNMDGEWVTGQIDWEGYWIRQIRQPVRFDLCIEALGDLSDALVIEAGPGKALSALISSSGLMDLPPIPTLHPRNPSIHDFDRALIECWNAGIRVQWERPRITGDKPVLLPGYRFERKAFWVKRTPSRSGEKGGSLSQGIDSEVVQDPQKTGVARDGGVSARIAELWANMLGRQAADSDASFFDLGGDSLMSVALIQGIKASCKIDFTLKDFLAAPTQHGIVSRVEALLANAREGESPATPAAIPKLATNAPIPLSPEQERLWFLHELDPDAPLYNLVGSFRLAGPWNREILLETLKRVFNRHEAFRTEISYSPAGPVLVIRDECIVPVQVFDLSGKGRDEALNIFEETVRIHAGQPMNYGAYPFIKADVFDFGELEARVCAYVPHILSDGWSLELMLWNLRDAYARAASGQAEPPGARIEYSDYAAWARERKSREVTPASIVDFWKGYLRGIPEVHQFPLDFPRPKRSTGKGGLTHILFTEAEAAAIRKACARHRITPNLFFLSAFALTVWKYSSQETVVIGTPYANREREELKDIFGYFIKTIPLRFDIAGESDATEWLSYAKRQFLGAWEHSRMGLDEIVEKIDVPRITDINPIYQILFAYQSYVKGDRDCESLSFSSDFADRGISENDIALYLWETDAFAGGIEYSTDLFERETMELLVKNFRTLAAGLADCEGKKIRELRLPAPAPWLASINATERPEYLGRTLTELFHDSCEEHGNRTAIRFEGKNLAYGELRRMVDGIAASILAAGIAPDAFVGVYLERSPLLIASFLAVMEAGCAYVPLDPAFPTERLRVIVSESGMKLIVTERGMERTEFLDGLETPRLFADEAGKSPGHLEMPKASPDRVAYMLFTSGSTGKPKGVPITQGSLSNLLLSMKEDPGIDLSDRVLAITTASFDISGLEFYLPLICGAYLVMVGRETTLDSERLAEIMDREGITVVQTTPSRMTLLLESGWKGNAGMKLLVGGEALPTSLARRILATGASVWNVYGPTETTIWSSICRISSGDGDPPIGKPVANTRFYVLDPQNVPLPPGVPGELGIAGAGLSPGYHGLDGLTREKFIEIETPYGRERVYKTGDLVRVDPAGTYRYLGRTDFQVKIRGFRIELGEIEGAIANFPGIREATCLVWNRSEQDMRIVAYYRAEAPVETNALRAFLGQSLPDYMIPGHFMALRDFPRTQSGKTDRKAFPLPEDDGATPGKREAILPENETQERMLAVWKRILDQDGFGITDGFFELGGHSLLATRLIKEMNESLGGTWTLRNLFENPTIESLAGCVAKPGERHIPLIFPANEKGGKTPIFLMSGVYANRYHDDSSLTAWEVDFFRYFGNIISLIGADRSIYGLRPRGIFKGERFHGDVASMATEYIREIKQIQPTGPYLIGGECLGGNVAYEIARQLRAEGEKVERLILLDTDRNSPLSVPLYHLIETRHRANRYYRGWVNADRKERSALERMKSVARRLRKTVFPVNATEREFSRLERGSSIVANVLLRYRPKPYGGSVLLLVNQAWNDRRPGLGWDSKMCPNLSIRVVRGDHTTRLTSYGNEFASVLHRDLENC